MGTYLSGARTLGWVIWIGAGASHSHGIPPNFYLPSVGVGPPILHLCASVPLHISVSLPLLPVWMDVASLIPWLSDFHTAEFSDDFG